MNPRKVTAALLTALGVATLAACGGGAATAESAAKPTTTTAVSTTTAAPTTTEAPTTTTEAPTTTVPEVVVPDYRLVVVPQEMLDGLQACDASVEGRTASSGYEEARKGTLLCLDGLWRWEMTTEIPRDTRLAMINCQQRLIRTITDVALGHKMQRPCDEAIDLLSLESDSGLLAIHDVVDRCSMHATLSAAEMELNALAGQPPVLPKDQVDQLMGDLSMCEDIIKAFAEGS